MATEVIIRREGSALLPVDAAQEAKIWDIPADKTLRATVKVPRDGWRLRRYHALCHRVAEALEAMGRDNATREHVDMVLRVATGFCELVPLPLALVNAHGVEYAALVRSLSFSSMGEAEFARFERAAHVFVAEYLLPHVTVRQLREDIGKIVGAPVGGHV